MKVFVVDPHAIYRRGLVASLELLERVESVYQADGVCGAREHSALFEADIVILDTSIAGGLGFIASIAEVSGAHVIACTSDCDEESMIGALEAGAVGYLRKDTLTQDVLHAAIQAAEGGAAIIAPEMLNAMLRSAPIGPASGPARGPLRSARR